MDNTNGSPLKIRQTTRPMQVRRSLGNRGVARRGDDLSNAQIAEQMHLSPKTTDKHREELDVNNAPQLIRKALQLGLLDSSG